MKKLILAGLIFGAAQVALADNVSDGTITFNGMIKDTTCSVKSESKDLTVTLPTVSKALLNTGNKTAGLTAFAIELENCDNGQARAYFEPTPGKVDLLSGRVLNTNLTTKDSVQIQLLDSNGTEVLQISENDGHQNSQYQTISSANKKLRYFARYYATATAVPGQVQGSVDYTVSYQ